MGSLVHKRIPREFSPLRWPIVPVTGFLGEAVLALLCSLAKSTKITHIYQNCQKFYLVSSEVFSEETTFGNNFLKIMTVTLLLRSCCCYCLVVVLSNIVLVCK